MKVTLDTNVLVRLAAQDDPVQVTLVLNVLQKAELITVGEMRDLTLLPLLPPYQLARNHHAHHWPS